MTPSFKVFQMVDLEGDLPVSSARARAGIFPPHHNLCSQVWIVSPATPRIGREKLPLVVFKFHSTEYRHEVTYKAGILTRGREIVRATGGSCNYSRSSPNQTFTLQSWLQDTFRLFQIQKADAAHT